MKLNSNIPVLFEVRTLLVSVRTWVLRNFCPLAGPARTHPPLPMHSTPLLLLIFTGSGRTVRRDAERESESKAPELLRRARDTLEEGDREPRSAAEIGGSGGSGDRRERGRERESKMQPIQPAPPPTPRTIRNPRDAGDRDRDRDRGTASFQLISLASTLLVHG